MTEDWNNNNMFQSIFFKFLMATSFLTFIFCNDEPGTVQTEAQYGSISGKIIHPDNNLLIRVLSEDGADTIPCNPTTKMFTADSIKYGNCLIQVKANDYMLFEKKLVLDEPQYICHDIVLSPCPWQVAYLDPSSSQHLDSVFCSIHEPSITDTGFMVCLTFSNDMDTASVGNALTILPDTVGVQKIWARKLSLYLLFPYSKLATTDTVKVSVSKMAKNGWGDTLEDDFSFFYTVDTNFIRTSRVTEK
jgi:hypothetical protein